MLKGKCSVKIAEYNQSIQKLREPEIPPTRKIGFAAIEYEEEEDVND